MEADALVGRDREMAIFGDELTHAAAGQGRVVIVDGEAGIGKSRLLREVVAMARTRAFEIRLTGCTEPERTIPFAAAVRLLGPAADGFLTETGFDLDAAEPSPALGFRVTEALGNAVEALASTGPVLIAVDDLQWADPATLLAVQAIAARLDRLPVLLVGTARAGHRNTELDRWVDELSRTSSLLLSLRPLQDEAVATLVTSVLGSAPSNELLERLRRAGGNPLYITEYARWSSNDDDRLPIEFRVAVLRRLAHLPAEAGDAIRLASVLGSSFLPRDLAVALDRSTVDIAPAIEAAAAAGVIEELGESLAFRHDLVRQAVYDHMAPAMRRALHREVGSRLADSGANPLVVAHHLALGADDVDTDAAAWLHRAAGTASHQAPAVAAELLERAVALLPVSSPVRAEMRADLVVNYAWSGRLAEAQSLAADVLSASVDPATATAMRAALVRALSWQGRAAEAMGTAGIADEEPCDAAGADLLMAETALARAFASDFRGAGVMAARAEEAATASGNALALCQALSVQVWTATFAGRPHEAVELGRRAIAIADASPGGSAQLAHPRFFPGMPLVMLDRLEEADRLLREGRQYAEERGLVWSLPMYHAFLGGKLFAAGEWDAAAAECEAGLDVADELGLGPTQVLVTAAWLAAIQVHRDEVASAERTIARARARVGTLPNIVLSWATALVHEARGEIDAALGELQGAWNILIAGGALADPFSPMTLVRLCVQSGDVDRAVALLPAVVRQATLTGTPFMRGQALRCQGLASDDPDLLLDAVTEYRQCPRPAELAAGCEDAGAALARHGRLHDAVPMLDEAHQLYEDLDARRDAARVRAVMRQHGVRRSGARRRASAESGWDSLTTTELNVVELVAQRLSNPEVAERLFVSRHTVESHLKRIYRKLGLSSRIELAAAAARRA